MKTKIYLNPLAKYLIIISCFLSQTNKSLSQKTNALPPNMRQPYLEIISIEPSILIEHSLTHIYFKFSNTGYQPNLKERTGWIAAEFDASNEGKFFSNQDWPITQLAPGATVYGVVTVTTPKAGLNRYLKIFYYDSLQRVGEFGTIKSPIFETDENNITVGGLFNFQLTGFKIFTTRSVHVDTDFGSLAVSVNNTPVSMPCGNQAANACTVQLGDLNNGDHNFQGKSLMGPNTALETNDFVVLPQSDQNLFLNYYIINNGYSGQHEAEEVLNIISDFTAGGLDAYSGGNSWDGLNIATQKLNHWITSYDCNGPVVADTMTIPNSSLFANTDNNSAMNITRRYNGEMYKSQNGCGHTSDYEVYSVLKRAQPDTSNKFLPQYHFNITANKQITLGFIQQSWSGIQTISNNNDEIINVSDPTYGYINNGIYYAPNNIQSPQLIILRGTTPNSNLINENSKEVVVFIQLVPFPHLNSNRFIINKN